MEDKKGDMEGPEIEPQDIKSNSKEKRLSTVLILGSSGKVRKFKISIRFAKYTSVFFLLYLIVSVIIINDYIQLRGVSKQQKIDIRTMKDRLYEANITLKKQNEHIALLKDYVASLEKRMEQRNTQMESVSKKDEEIQIKTEKRKEHPSNVSFVDVQDMVIQKEGSRMTVDFKVVNIREGNEPVGGYIHIIARREGEDSTRNWTYPQEKLVDGLPADYKKGQPFLIQRFKPIHGRFNIPPGSKHPTVVIVLIYDHTGEILLKREFEVGSVS